MSLLTKKFFLFNKRPFALDISDVSLKVLDVSGEENGCQIESLGEAKLPLGIIEDGVVKKESELIFSLKNLLERTLPRKIKSKNVICSVPESKVFSRIINIPGLDLDEAQEAVKWELEANIPLSIDEVYFDWQFLNEDGNEKKRSVLAMAVSKKIIDDLVLVLEKSGLNVVALEPESIAQIRSLIGSKVSSRENFLIIDIGSNRTSLIITQGQLPIFSSGAIFSSEGVTDMIEKHFGIPREQAEEIKIQQTNTRYDENNSILSIAEPLLENLVSGVEKSIDFCFGGEKKPSDLKRIILSGGGGNLRGLDDFLKNKLGADVVLGSPCQNTRVKKNSPKIEQRAALEFATAFGLAMRNFYDIEN